jgi:hypothetical protein
MKGHFLKRLRETSAAVEGAFTTYLANIGEPWAREAWIAAMREQAAVVESNLPHETGPAEIVPFPHERAGGAAS